MVLGIVEGDLYLSDGACVRAGDSEKVEVRGTVQYVGDCTFKCSLSAGLIRGRRGDLTVDGDLSVERSIRIHDGGLEVSGDLSAKNIEVDRAVLVGKNLSVESIEVGGKIKVEGDTKGGKIEVGGSFEAQGDVEAEQIEAGGTVKIDGRIKAVSYTHLTLPTTPYV